MHLKKDFREFAELLNSTGVKYVIVGAYAVACHGISRYTKDMDFFVESSPENAAKLIRVLEAFGFGSAGVQAIEFTRPGKVFQLGVEPTRIDLLTGVDGLDFAEAYASRIMVDVDGLPLPFLNKELLLRNKRAAGRPQDLADAARLEALG